MTKLCNSCEYLKFCARSSIEEVGCYRYKRDTTTNEEYLRSCSSDELVSILCELVDSGILQEWCIKYHCADSDEDAVRIWLKGIHK